MGAERDRKLKGDVASERIELLLDQAAALSKSDPDSANNRVRLAHSISLRCRVRIPKHLKARYCKKCLTYFSGESLICRLNPKKHRLERKCLKCGHVAYQPYVMEKKKRG
jgi:ribonuclease P protein subunit RPR2